MTTDIVARRDTDSWVDVLGPVGTLAGNIADTEFVPKQLRGKTAAVAACILAGREIGVGPMEALQKIYVVDGRPSMGAELMRSLILRDGHELVFRLSTNEKCTLAGRRRGSQEWTEVTWTLTDAQRIGVAGKDVWKKYPRQMLANRCTSELARLMFADVLSGISQTPDEIEDEISAKPVTIVRSEVDAPAKVQRKRAAVAAPAIVEPEFDEPTVDTETGEIIEEGEVLEFPAQDAAPVLASKEQSAALVEALRVNGYTNRAQMLAYCQQMTGREELANANDLTADEVAHLLTTLGVEA